MNKNIKYFYDNYIQSLNIISKNKRYGDVNKLLEDVWKHYEYFLLKNEKENFQKFFKIRNHFYFYEEGKINFSKKDFWFGVNRVYSKNFYINNILIFLYKYINKIHPHNLNFYQKYLRGDNENKKF